MFQVNDPVKAIQSVRHRLARLAALQTITALLPPLVVLIAVGIGLRALGQQSWERWGLVMPAETARMLQFGLLCAAAVGLVTGGVLAGLAYRRSLDPVAAAEQIDLKLGSRQEVLTLATMAGAAPGSSRSPLFPILWRRASQHLDRLDPPRMFPFEVKRPLRQGLFLTVSTVGLIAAGISVLLAANQPLLGAQSRQLRKIAREIANSNPADAQTRE